MNIKKVKLKIDVFRKHAKERGVNKNVVNDIINELDGKFMEINTDESFMPRGSSEIVHNLMGFAIFEDELEFV